MWSKAIRCALSYFLLIVHHLLLQYSVETEKDVFVPLYGDQLGRERVTGAKKTRLGCDLPSERY